MKLNKALKLKKKIAGEIANLKSSIQTKNSYIDGTIKVENYDVNKIYLELLRKIEDLTSLKYAINEANREIQSKIYLIGEYKGLINFWQGVTVHEGTFPNNYGGQPTTYVAQIDEKTRDNMVKEFQTQIDSIQDEIDVFNYTTEIPWDEYIPENDTRVIPTISIDKEKFDSFNDRIKAKDDELTIEQTEQMSSK